MKIRFKKYFNRSISFIALWLSVLVISCGKEVSHSPLEPEPPKGFIYINSVPDRFTIFSNGRNTGRLTPDSISYIDAGEYQITLKKKYFKDTSLIVTLNEDERLTLNFDILSNPSMYGGLLLQSVPLGAGITVNDSTLNKVTPVTLQNLLPGEYRVKYNLINHRDVEFRAIVESGKTNSYSPALRDTSVWVDYQLSNSGIQSNSLYPIAIDHNDVKWIGTMDKGLIRYDEINFLNYNTSNSQIPSNRLNCITVDNQNRIWVGTDQGIGIFDGNSWVVYNSSNSGLTMNYINIIRFSNDGLIWIGTSGNLVKFDGIDWTVYDQPKGKDWINDIYFESENRLYLGTKMDGIFLFESGTFTWIRWWDYHYCTMTVTSIGKDHSNNVWYCFSPDTIGRSGISKWDGLSYSNIYIGSIQNSANNIFIDDQDNKLVSTSEGFAIYDFQNNAHFFSMANSLITSNNVSASSVDSKGQIWITTVGGGLNKYKPPQ